jgi:hypothetical protein
MVRKCGGRSPILPRVNDSEEVIVCWRNRGRAALQWSALSEIERAAQDRRKNGALAPAIPEFEEPWMEALTRLVIDSLSRHGFDRPIDPRRLQWSSWFRCDSPRSLLVVPSKPGIFAIAEEILDFGNAHVGTAAPESLPLAQSRGPAEQSSAAPPSAPAHATTFSGGAALQRSDSLPAKDTALAAEPTPTKRMLGVLQFAEDDDMAFTLDRMFTRINPMRARLTSGNCFLRFVVAL